MSVKTIYNQETGFRTNVRILLSSSDVVDCLEEYVMRNMKGTPLRYLSKVMFGQQLEDTVVRTAFPNDIDGKGMYTSSIKPESIFWHIQE